MLRIAEEGSKLCSDPTSVETDRLLGKASPGSRYIRQLLSPAIKAQHMASMSSDQYDIYNVTNTMDLVE